MIRLSVVLVLLASASVGCTGGERQTLYVSPTGSDVASGSESSPLRSLYGARDRLRKLRSENPQIRQMEVVFEDGLYDLREMAEFGSGDGGSVSAPVVYRSRNRGKAVFCGGIMPQWEELPADDPARKLIQAHALAHVRTARIPDNVELPGFAGGRCFLNAHPAWLYADGQPLPIASYPDMARRWEDLHLEFADIQGDGKLFERNEKDEKFTRFGFSSPRIASWTVEPDMWIYGLLNVHWDDSSAKVVSVDPDKGVLTIKRNSIIYLPKAEGICRVFNALSELDRPGEWAVDRERRRLYFWPEGGPEPSLSATRTLLKVERASNLVFDGFVFEHCRAEAVVFDECTNVTLRGSCVRAVGGNGVCVRRGRDCLVEDCDLVHLGEGGILLSGGDRATLEPAGHVARNNHVSYWGDRLAFYRPAIGFGDVNPQSPGVIVGCRIEHNLMHHGRHLAVRLCGNDVSVAWNVFHDVCAATCDAGAVYGYTESDWTQSRGAIVEHNVFHAVGHLGAGKLIYTIYNDGFLSGVTVRGNIVVTGDVGLFHQGGHANVYERNLVVCCTKSAHRNNLGNRHPASAKNSKMWKNLQSNRNLYLSEPWKSRYPRLAEMVTMTNAAFAQSTLFTSFKDNVFSCSGAPVFSDGEKLAGWNIVENNVSLKDPGFVDFAGFDWRLRPSSPAADVVGNMGVEKMGLRPSRSRFSPPVKFGVGVSPPPPLKTPLLAPVVRVDMERTDGSFTDAEPMAVEFVNCEIPQWSEKRTRVRSRTFDADAGLWRTYSLSFMPRYDGDFRIFLMGSRGRMTAFDEISAEGAQVVNGSFETDEGWSLGVLESARAMNEPEHAVRGIVEGGPVFPAAQGRRVAVVNHDFTLSQTVRLKKGVRFILTWKARAWNSVKTKAK